MVSESKNFITGRALRKARAALVLILMFLLIIAWPGTALADVPAGVSKTFDNGGGDGLWQTAANWNPDGLPGSGDKAYIPAGYSVTLSSGNHIINTLHNDGTITVSAGSSLSVASTLESAGTLNLDGGQITISSTSAITGTFNWTGGVIDVGANTLTLAGTSVFNASTSTNLTGNGGTLENSGQLTWTGAGSILLVPATSVTVKNSGTFIDNAPSGYGHRMDWVYAPGVTARFINTGSYIKQGTLETKINVPFTNSGTVDVQAGRSHSGAIPTWWVAVSTGLVLPGFGGIITLAAR